MNEKEDEAAEGGGEIGRYFNVLYMKPVLRANAETGYQERGGK